MLRFFFKNRQDPAVGRLYQMAVDQARSPVFYQNFGVADTLDGRFEMIVFHITPLIDALRTEDGALDPAGQALFDTFLADMEQNLRTIGVGDMSVPKKMKKMGAAFYGRFDAYRRARGTRGELAAAIARNVLDDPDRPASAAALALADYFAAMADAAPATLAAADRFAFPNPMPFAPNRLEAAQ